MSHKICAVFDMIADHTCFLLKNARSLKHQMLEETITDLNVLIIKCHMPSNVITKTFTKKEEGKNGSDWEWWFTDSNKSFWFGVRVQAKIVKFNTDRFESLYYKNQTDDLISSAASSSPKMYPLYCFYSDWSGGVSSGSSGICHNCNRKIFSYGCSLMDAYDIKKLKSSSKKKDLNTIVGHSIPLACLVCCQGGGSSGDNLPQRVQKFLKTHAGFQSESYEEGVGLQEVPEVSNFAPKHVLDLLDPDLDDLDFILDEQLAGVMIFVEDQST